MRSNPDESAIKSTRLGFKLVRPSSAARRVRSTTASSMKRKRSVCSACRPMVFNGELFWDSNRIDMLIERIGSYIEREGLQAD